MDRQALMKRRSVPAALAAALFVSGMKEPATAMIALVAGQVLFYGWAWVTAQPRRAIWSCGTRTASETRRWMLSTLCGLCVGMCMLLAGRALFQARFHCDAPMMTALLACFAARACTLRVFSRWMPNMRGTLIGAVGALACVSVCLYPLF